MSQELVHITVGYPRNSFMDLLQECSHWNGCKFVGLPKYWGSPSFNLVAKVTIVKAYLETGDIDMDSVVLFTDAYDVLIVEHASSILEKFHATGADLIFAAEPNFFPTDPGGREATRAQFDTCDSIWRYLNSGAWIGYAWAAKQMLDDVSAWVASNDFDPSWTRNDQPFVQEYYLKHRDSKTCRVMLDTDTDFFCCLFSHIDEFVVDHSRVRVRRSGKPVSILHANGDKANLNILPRYWALCGGSRGIGRLHDLRVASVGGQVLAYDADRHKLVPSNCLDPALAVFLVKGDRHALLLSPQFGVLTFNPGGVIGHGAPKVDIWEIVGARGGITTYHDTTLDTYCATEAGQDVTLVPLSLQALLAPSFDGLLELIARYESKL